ncbi:hypothetical protein ACQP1G_16385 [Nocardia sp. CA-107356]|uniref:hypothetical protein n=1 Tax=Nocardia sp. CA-107356 TaxID=3239972 RepID=UPI003D8B0914
MRNELRPGYLDPAVLTHVNTNIGDCYADPGRLTSAEAMNGLTLHLGCSSGCVALARIRQVLGIGALDLSRLVLPPGEAVDELRRVVERYVDVTADTDRPTH